MKRIMLLAGFLLAFALGTSAQPGYVPTDGNLRNREEFASQKLGIFIHWGIYSMLGQGEWALQTRELKHSEYRHLADGFYPSGFNADDWARAIKASGAGYVTFTSRHHDGFSMWDSQASDYNVVKGSPFGRDIIGELADACRKHDLDLHLYYSHLDWGRDDYWPRGRTGLLTGRPDGKQGDWTHYQEFMDAQLTELLTSYGPIRAIWFDGVWDMDSRPREDQPGIWGLYHQYELIHSLQPDCLIGNNHHLVPFEGEDIQIFERDVPGDNTAGYSGENGISASLPLETCQTMNESWGYRITDVEYKSVDEIIRLLVRTSGKGANLLLNIGPRPDGTLPDEALVRLEALGDWLGRNGESIYGTSAGQVSEQNWGVTTAKGNKMYVHVLGDESVVFIPYDQGKVKSAVALSDGAKVKYTQTREGVIVTMDGVVKDGPDRIVVLELGK